MRINAYTIFARILPAIISSVPFFALHYFFLRPVIGEFWGELLGLEVASNATIAVALFFLLIQMNRLISKSLFEKRRGGNATSFPSIDFLLHMDTHFSPEHTKRIHEKIKSDFGIDIPSVAEEELNQARSKQRIAEALSLVRARVGDGILVRQHNAEYGFARNLAGGSILAFCVSLFNVALFTWVYPDSIAFGVSYFSLPVYAIIFFFVRRIMRSASNAYAEILIQEYLLKN